MSHYALIKKKLYICDAESIWKMAKVRVCPWWNIQIKTEI